MRIRVYLTTYIVYLLYDIYKSMFVDILFLDPVAEHVQFIVKFDHR